MTLLDEFYVREMPCPVCETKDVKLTTRNTLYCESTGCFISPEDRFLFLEGYMGTLLEMGGVHKRIRKSS